jgi:serine/threonine protein phosphatase PrpC
MERFGGESLAGCTANVVLISKDEIICANAGDSRSILRNSDVTYLPFLFKKLIIVNFCII